MQNPCSAKRAEPPGTAGSPSSFYRLRSSGMTDSPVEVQTFDRMSLSIGKSSFAKRGDIKKAPLRQMAAEVGRRIARIEATHQSLNYAL